MRTTTGRIMWWPFSFTVCLTLFFSPTAVPAQEEFLCVWRNPERTMTRIFPNALDYRTVTARIAPEKRAAIEKRLGFELLPGQREQFQYFEMVGENQETIGTVIAASQKGEFGAIEFVFGLDRTQAIKGLYIQRARERDVRFKDRTFLDLFEGKKISDAPNLTKVYTGPQTPGTSAVLKGIAKELVTLNEVVLSKN